MGFHDQISQPREVRTYLGGSDVLVKPKLHNSNNNILEMTTTPIKS